MCVDWSFKWQSELVVLLGGNVCYCMSKMAMCVVVCFRWHCVLMGLLGGNVCYCMF